MGSVGGGWLPLLLALILLLETGQWLPYLHGGPRLLGGPLLLTVGVGLAHWLGW